MKRLNNRGFAITAVLYGLLILFLLLFLGMIRILNTERKRMEKISDEIDKSIVNMDKIDINSDNMISEGGIYVTPYRGKYVFKINGDETKEYYMYLPIYSIVSIKDKQIKVTRGVNTGTGVTETDYTSKVLNGMEINNSNITSITITGVYTSVRKNDTP